MSDPKTPIATQQSPPAPEPRGGGYTGRRVVYTPWWYRYQVRDGKRPRPPSPPAIVTLP